MSESTRRAETDKQQETCQELLTHRVEKDLRNSFLHITELPKLKIDWSQLNIGFAAIGSFIFAILVVFGTFSKGIYEILTLTKDVHHVEARIDILEDANKEDARYKKTLQQQAESNFDELSSHIDLDVRIKKAVEKALKKANPDFEMPE